MEISEETEEWLRESGYRYYCFISYPKVHDDMHKFAERVRRAIQDKLAESGLYEPRVFIAHLDIPTTALWESALSRALCSSVTMVALCLSAYYRGLHRWCGIEWATMDKLGRERLRSEVMRPIIPILLRDEKPIPQPVLATQCMKMTAASLTWEQHCDTFEFKDAVRQIVDHIGDVAELLRGNEAAAGACAENVLAEDSAFAGWQAAKKEFPLHGKN